MPTQIQLRRGTAAEWTSVNPVLMAGEFGVETDTDKMKVGNGSATWTARPYLGGISALDVYPIGSIYTSTVATNPSTYFGGTWVAEGEGRVLVGFASGDPDFGTAGATPGAKTVTLDSTQIPSHTHTQNSHNHTQDAHNHTQDSHNHTQVSHNHTQNSFAPRIINSGTAGTVGVQGASAASNANASNSATTATNQAATAVNNTATATNQSATATNQAATAVNQSTGGGLAHNNIQPSLVVYMFRRTA
jgi:microcystin-dependent protein